MAMGSREAKLLALMVLLFLGALSVAIMLRFDDDPLMPIFFACFLVFYFFLYMWRWLRDRYEDAGLRRGLGHAAVLFGVMLWILLPYFVRGLPLPSAILYCLFFSAAQYTLYRITVLHIDLEEEEAVQAQRRGGGGNHIDLELGQGQAPPDG